MTERKRRKTSNPRDVRLSLRVTKEEKENMYNLADRLELTLTDTVLEGIKALDEKYRLIKK